MHSLRLIVLIGLGGFIGSVSRYFLSAWANKAIPGAWLPYGTLAVNVTGCFVIGLMAGILDHRAGISNELRLLIFSGLLGGFTTYSAFGLETVAMLRDHQPGLAIFNVGLHLLVALPAVWLGYLAGRTAA